MSEIAISRLTISSPLAVLTFRLRLFLLTLVSLKFPDVFRLTSRFWGVVLLGSLPRSFSGHSIFMISAPKAPSQRVAHGPARTQLKSTTRMLSRARGRDMASFSDTSSSDRSPLLVIPAKAGIHGSVDPGLRRDDNQGGPEMMSRLSESAY